METLRAETLGDRVGGRKRHHRGGEQRGAQQADAEQERREIARQRYTYNNIVQQFNTMLDTIPSSFVGRLVGLLKLEYLQFEEAVATPPKIEF